MLNMRPYASPVKALPGKCAGSAAEFLEEGEPQPCGTLKARVQRVPRRASGAATTAAPGGLLNRPAVVLPRGQPIVAGAAASRPAASGVSAAGFLSTRAVRTTPAASGPNPTTNARW